MSSGERDIAIIGGGIVGLAAALALRERHPRCSLVLMEKEKKPGMHQTGHNSGVIHAGIYYKPGSRKAILCAAGVRMLEAFCDENGIPYERCGKLIVATTQDEIPRLWSLYERGVANGIPGLQIIGPERAREIEPFVAAEAALYSQNTAIVDYGAVAAAMMRRLQEQGVEILLETQVLSIRRSNGRNLLETGGPAVSARYLISCAGLHSDRISRMMGIEPKVQIIPFRGEYYSLRPSCRRVRGLIYPVPDPQFPFLGVHFTKKIDGTFEAGPNAVLAFAREGYSKTSLSMADTAEMLTFPGFWRMARRYWRTGFYEYYRSWSRKAFLKALQRLVPSLELADMEPGGSGVRAQAVTLDGSLADDFLMLDAPGALHVLNAPSPAATASLAIGRHIAETASLGDSHQNPQITGGG